MAEVEPEVVAELNARQLLVTVEDRDEAKILILTCDEQQVEISSEPGPLLRSAGGFEELGREALAVAELLRARAVGQGEPRDWYTPPEVTSVPKFDGGRIIR